MRCRKCGQRAAINMRHHRLALCSIHFPEWLMEQTQRFIEKYNMFTPSDRLLVAVSGGKDSLSLWDILWRLGYQTVGLYIDLGIDGGIRYSARSRQCAQQFAGERGLVLEIYNLQSEIGRGLPDLANQNQRGKEKPCSPCGLVKRYIMNRFALKQGFDALVTAHNLDDEAAILLANTLDWSLEHLSRGLPVMPSGAGFVKKVKPFCRISERESAAYAIMRGIVYMEDECPYSVGSKQLFFKHHLNEWEDKMPGVKLRFYNNYLKAVEAGAFPERQDSAEILSRQQCGVCGQPTTANGLCAFCRITLRK